MIARLRRAVADALLERPRYELRLRRGDWVGLRNRHDRLAIRPGQRGVAVEDRWTSRLFLPERDAVLSARIHAAAFAEWPIAAAEEPSTGPPQVSFIVGHRGAARLPLLLACLRSLAGQSIACEAIVVEQDDEPRVPAALPSWVRHVFQRVPTSGMPFCRSWAFNRGVLEAAAPIVVLHDGDAPAPARYAEEVVRLCDDGWQAARLARFVFHLSLEDSAALPAPPRFPMTIVQNCQGVTIAVRRESYLTIGGHDESFVGWGGEDNEFFERLRTLRLHEASYLPFLHLWHPTAAAGPGVAANLRRLEERSAIPVADRVRELAGRPMGGPAGPWGFR